MSFVIFVIFVVFHRRWRSIPPKVVAIGYWLLAIGYWLLAIVLGGGGSGILTQTPTLLLQDLKATGEKGIRDISPKVNTTKRKRGWNPFIFIMNNIKWIRKVSPMSAQVGIRNATKVLEQRFLPKAEWEFKKIK